MGVKSLFEGVKKFKNYLDSIKKAKELAKKKLEQQKIELDKELGKDVRKYPRGKAIPAEEGKGKKMVVKGSPILGKLKNYPEQGLISNKPLKTGKPQKGYIPPGKKGRERSKYN